MSITPRLTADQIARRSVAPPNFIDDLRSFALLNRKREDRVRFLRELGWWVLVIVAPVVAGLAIVWATRGL